MVKERTFVIGSRDMEKIQNGNASDIIKQLITFIHNDVGNKVESISDDFTNKKGDKLFIIKYKKEMEQ